MQVPVRRHVRCREELRQDVQFRASRFFSGPVPWHQARVLRYARESAVPCIQLAPLPLERVLLESGQDFRPQDQRVPVRAPEVRRAGQDSVTSHVE